MLSGKHRAMPPKGQNRPADVASNAVRVMQIATGQVEEPPVQLSPAAALGKLGGIARAKKLSKAKIKSIAMAAAKARWKKRKKPTH